MLRQGANVLNIEWVFNKPPTPYFEFTFLFSYSFLTVPFSQPLQILGGSVGYWHGRVLPHVPFFCHRTHQLQAQALRVSQQLLFPSLQHRRAATPLWRLDFRLHFHAIFADVDTLRLFLQYSDRAEARAQTWWIPGMECKWLVLRFSEFVSCMMDAGERCGVAGIAMWMEFVDS